MNWNTLVALIALLALQIGSAVADDKDKDKKFKFYVVEVKTTEGALELELNREKAAVTVDNFLAYAKDGFYEGTLIHRVEKGHVVQGGGFERAEDGLRRPKSLKDKKPIKSEAGNGLKNKRGAIAAARWRGPDTAFAEFFINLADNSQFDHPKPAGHGYTVFGKVTKGMEVIDKIAELEVSEGSVVFTKMEDEKEVDDAVKVPFVPKKDIVIEKVSVLSKRD
jgi:cyclophilin family peptidyl-prolyl cis-trans isomerase